MLFKIGERLHAAPVVLADPPIRELLNRQGIEIIQAGGLGANFIVAWQADAEVK
ncbi:MAG: DUF3124 domain-containing protein [Planctomycetia bacterium]|nr:DUF3124 domain-containing protein [Planctomycetia bacterium]